MEPRISFRIDLGEAGQLALRINDLMSMKNHMLKVKWLVLLFVSSSVLIWRLMDFACEAANEGFHMTRYGLSLRGADAEAIQMVIILGSIAFTWNVVTRLARLQVTDPSR